MISSQTKRGTDYTIIEKVISIVIADFVLIRENDEYHNKFHLYDPRTMTRFTDIIEVNTLELKKLPKDDDLSDLWDWMKFISAKEENEMAELEKIAENNPEIKRAIGVLKEMSRDEAERELAISRERMLSDIRAREAYVRKEGKAEKAIEVARNLKTDNVPVEIIAKATGLSVEDIDKL